MMARVEFRSDLSESIQASATMLHQVGALDAATMRGFDLRHMAVPTPIEPAQIKQLREASNVSQPEFARDLNTSERTIVDWETGAKRPSGMASKLLLVIRKHGLQVLA